jgi:hypothetical protein
MDLPGWDSLESVTWWHSVFEIAGIVFLALLVIAEIFAFIYSHRKDTLADAHENAYAKQLSAIKERDEPRSLTEAQRLKLIDLLSKEKTYELTLSHSPDIESQNFADQISTILKSAGWTIDPPGFRIMIRDATGLFIFVHDLNSPPEGSLILQRALKDALGISAPASAKAGFAPGSFELHVGPKPLSPAER